MNRKTPMKPTPALPPERSLGYQVRRCHRMFDRMLSARLASHDLNSGFWYYLRALWMQDGLTQKELSDVTNVAENTTVTMVNLMIKKGLVTRTRDVSDRRKLRICLTQRGRRLQAELFNYAFEINDVAAAGIPLSQIETCLSVLAQVSENLQRSLAAGQAGNSVTRQRKPGKPIVRRLRRPRTETS